MRDLGEMIRIELLAWRLRRLRKPLLHAMLNAEIEYLELTVYDL